MNDKLWIILVDWFKEEDGEFRLDDYYFYNTAEDALDFAYQLCHSKSAYETAGEPTDAYLFHCAYGEPFPEGGDLFDAAWFNLDSKFRALD